LLAAVGLIAVPAISLAHPLGNFTINHFAELRVGADGIELQVVIDQAEIPAFQARQAMDADGDGTVSETERATGATAACADLTGSLDLRMDGVRQTLASRAAGLSFPPGVGGLSTMRLMCDYAVDGRVRTGTAVTFADTSYAERIGWREIVVAGGATGTGLRTATVSERLIAYPAELLARPLDDRSVAFEATAVAAAADPVVTTTEPIPTATVAAAEAAAVGVPGGVIAGELPAILRAADLTPVVLLLSLLTAAALGAGHALTPGHGKTLMAAYLVGTRGTPLHAVALGLSVTVSHTLGILVLAAVVVGAQGVLAPDVVVRGAPIVAAVSIVAIGGWMLLGEGRRRRAAAAHAHDHDHEHPHPHDDDHEHAHGGIAHSHRPPAGTITWRGLFALGLAGGLIPSTSALLILLGSSAAGRPAFGFVLVVAFGIGMAAVMAGIGVALVLARGRLDQVDARSPLGRAGAVAPLVAAILVFGLGCYLTVQAVGGAPTL
jgi:nickel/cobalt transporter (NicO) family protein